MTHNEQVFAMAGASEFRPPKQMLIEKLKYKFCLKAKIDNVQPGNAVQ
ncbi:MAG: hypothetical protein H7069_07880 [Phormidesmis sp. FL-bin-119]|nr:hypothetical protein [Pedobacter sp.]